MAKQAQKTFCSLIVFTVALASFLLAKEVKAASYGDTSTWLSRLYAGDGGNARDAYLDFPEGMTKDSDGNFYIADTWNNVIRKIDASTNTIVTLAGTGSYGYKDGPVLSAQFAKPHDVVVDSEGVVYVADTENNKIRKIAGGNVSTLAISGLKKPEGVEIHPTSNDYLYIADTGNNVIREFKISENKITRTWFGFKRPTDLDFEWGAGSYHIYVADSGHHQVKGINIFTGEVGIIAGSGSSGYKDSSVGSEAQFDQIKGIVIDKETNCLYVSDRLASQYKSMIRKISFSGSHSVSTLIDDTAMVTLDYPRKLVIKGNYLYVLNKGIGTIQKFNKFTGYSKYPEYLIAGKERYQNKDGRLVDGLISRPWDLVVSPDKMYLYIAENNKISRVRLSDGYREWIVGHSIDHYRNLKGKEARFNNITGIAISPDGKYLYVVERGNHRIRGIRLSDFQTFLVSGTGLIQQPGEDNGYQEGTRDVARFNNPGDLAISPDGQYLYVTDTNNNRIRKVRISDGQTWLLAGSGIAGYTDGKGSSAQFSRPFGIDIDPLGLYLYVADTNNHVIRKIRISDGSVTTLAGHGTPGYQDAQGSKAYFSYPEYIHYGLDGYLYVTEVGPHRIRRIDPKTGYVLTVVGVEGKRGYKDSDWRHSQFNDPKGMVRVGDYLYVADSLNDLVRRVYVVGRPHYLYPAPSLLKQPLSPFVNQFKPDFNRGKPFNIRIYGSNFRYGIRVWFDKLEAYKVWVESPTTLLVTVPFDKMKTGWYDLTVQTLDGQKATLKFAFVVTNPDGSLPPKPEVLVKEAKSILSFFAYAEAFRGGIRVASGDVDGDGKEEIVVGSGKGGGPQIRIFSRFGKLIRQFFAYDPKFRGGVEVAVGDIHGDGKKEIIVGPGEGGGPQIRVFNNKGKLLLQFFAFHRDFRGGVNVALGDLDGDGKDEIIAGAGFGGSPHVRIFSSKGRWTGWDMFPFHPKFRGGVKVAAGDVDGDGKDEIGVCQALKAEAWCKVYKYDKAKTILGEFRAYPKGVECGANLAMADILGDRKAEIITGAGLTGGPQVRVFSGSGGYLGISFFAYSPLFRGGVFVASSDIDNDGKAEIITGAGRGGGPQVRIFKSH